MGAETEPEQDSAETPGQAAYRRYGEATDGLTFEGGKLLAWQELPERIQRAWEAVGSAFRPWGQTLPFRPGDSIIFQLGVSITSADRTLIRAQLEEAGVRTVIFLPPGLVRDVAVLRPVTERLTPAPKVLHLCWAESPSGSGELCDRLAGHTPPDKHSWAITGRTGDDGA